VQKIQPVTESGRRGIPQSATDQAIDPGQEIASLRLTGADRFDPVRFHFIAALARRVNQHEGEVKRILEGRLVAALAVHGERFARTQEEARETIARITARYPDAADDLQRLFVAGDFSSVRRLVSQLEKNHHPLSLADLARQLAQASPEDAEGGLGQLIGARAELKSMRYFRNTWSRLSVERQVTQAIEQAPENAGPLNSHLLVLRSLALMRDISPDYLNRFVSHVDTLLWLDQADKKNRPMVKKPLPTKATRRP
jgi:hypothetical protein